MYGASWKPFGGVEYFFINLQCVHGTHRHVKIRFSIGFNRDTAFEYLHLSLKILVLEK